MSKPKLPELKSIKNKKLLIMCIEELHKIWEAAEKLEDAAEKVSSSHTVDLSEYIRKLNENNFAFRKTINDSSYPYIYQELENRGILTSSKSNFGE